MPYRKQNDADREEVEARGSARGRNDVGARARARSEAEARGSARERNDVEAPGPAHERSDIESSALWPHAADGSSGLRERGASWPSEGAESETRGPTLGPYELLTPMGTTAYGRAFRARHQAQGRDVTLHFLPRAGVGGSAQASDLPLAVAKCAQLSHANVIAIEEYGQHEGTSYVVTEPLEGVSLADCLDDVCTLPLSRALSIAVQVGRALRAAHKLGIVHGALTPTNVRLVMTEQGELARVVGFGGALFRDQGAESARSSEPDVRGDVFAVGQLLFRMLAGRPPPVADARAGVRERNEVAGTVPLLSAWSAEPVPRALDELVARCLEPRPEHRLADLVALTRGLREIARRVDASLRSEVDARGPVREYADARGPGRQPYVDGSSHGIPSEGGSSSRAPRADSRGPAREPYVDARAAAREPYVGARGPVRALRGRSPSGSDHAPVREYGPVSDSDPAGNGAESPIRYGGVAWIVLGLLLALAAVWLVWHASGRGQLQPDHRHTSPAAQ